MEGAAGESANANHKDWIDIASYTWGASQLGTMFSGGGGGAGKVSFNDLHVEAKIDKATPTLLKYCASGKHVDEVKLSLCKAGGTQIEYSTVVLKDVLVTTARIIGTSGDDSIAIAYSFQAAKVEQHYWVQQKDGTRGAESQFGWDVKANQATA